MVGAAVNVTLVKGQMVVAVALMLTLAGRFGFTVMVMVLEVAGLPVAHAALDVSTQVTRSPLFNVVLENDAEFTPTFAPLIFH